MKVLHLINNLRREGAQMVIYNLVTASAAEHVRHLVCARQPDGALALALTRRGVPVFAPERYFPAVETMRSVHFIEQLVAHQGIDLIHAHMADAAFLGWRAARRSSRPLVITHHGHDLLPTCNPVCRAVFYLCLMAAARYARANVAISAHVATRLRTVLGLHPGRITVIANGVPLVAVDAAPLPCGTDLRVVAVGRLVELKGHEQLIAAARALVGRYPDARFFIVGDGPLRERLQGQIETHGLARHVILTGAVDDVSIYLRQANIYVSNSHHEGMPIATLEAMAFGLPVIASDVPGNRDVVAHERTGLLYPLHDTSALAAAITRVMSEPELAPRLTQAARHLIETHYDSNNTARAHGHLYDSVIAGAASS